MECKEVGLWHFRVHFGEYDYVDIVKFMTDNADVACSVLEKDDCNRPHIHTVITGFKQTQSTFRQKFKKLFPKIDGNEGYALHKKDDIDAQLRYCMKGPSIDKQPFILVCRKDVNSVELHEAYWKEFMRLRTQNKGVNMGCQNDPSLNTKAKSKTWTERTYEEIMLKCVNDVNVIITYWTIINPCDRDTNEYTLARMSVFRYMMRCLGKSAKKISSKICKEIFDGFINGIVQTNVTAGDNYSDDLFREIYH